MKKIMKTNEKHGFSRYVKANADTENIKVKDFISTQKQFHIYYMIIYTTIPCSKDSYLSYQ